MWHNWMGMCDYIEQGVVLIYEGRDFYGIKCKLCSEQINLMLFDGSFLTLIIVQTSETVIILADC